MNLPDNTELVNLRLELARERDRADAFRHAFNVEVLKVMRAAVIQATISADEEIARLKDRVKELEDARPIGTASKLDMMETYGLAGCDVRNVMANLRMDEIVHRITYSGRLSVYVILTPGNQYRVRVEDKHAIGRTMPGGWTAFAVKLDGPAEDSNEVIMTLKEIVTDDSSHGRDSITLEPHA